MSTVKIKGSNNVANAGAIHGDYNVNSTIINLEFNITDFNGIFAMNENEKEKSLINMTEAQMKLAEAIDKFSQAELIRAESSKVRDEADKLRAEADKNNSLANLNYSKIMLEDREIIKQLMVKLK